MAQGIGIIQRVTNGGGTPFLWTWDSSPESAGLDNTSNAASLNAALDALKPLAAALPGTIQRIEISVTSL